MCSLLLLSFLAGSAAPPAFDPLLSEEVALERLPSSQVIGLDPRRPLEDELELGGRRFAVEIGPDRLRVATVPEAKPTERVKHGDAVTLRWLEDGNPTERSIRFELDDRGRWAWGPATARVFRLQDFSLFLIDVDLDGRFVDRGRDGWCTIPGAPLQQLDEVLNVGAGRLTIRELAPDGSRLTARLQPHPGTSAQREALAILNRFRFGQGLPGLELETGLSLGCSAHAKYLVLNEWDGKSDPHDEPPRTPGGTVEGRIAARVSWIRPLPLARAAETLCSSYPEAIALTDPGLSRIGLSDRAESPAVIDFTSRDTRRGDPTIRWQAQLLAPADGSIDCPTRSPGADRKGPPLLLRLADENAEIADYRAELFALGSGKPRRLETILIEDAARPGILAALPTRRLKSRATYRVTHHFTIDGEPRSMSAVFRTR